MKKLSACYCVLENKGISLRACPRCRGYYLKREAWELFIHEGKIVTGHVSRDGKLVDVRPVAGLSSDPRQAVACVDGKEIRIYLTPLLRREEFHWNHTATAVCRHGEEGFLVSIDGEKVFVVAKEPFAATNERARAIRAWEESQKENRALWRARRELENLIAEASSQARVQSLAVDLLARDGKKARRHASGQNIYTWPEVAERLFGHLKDKFRDMESQQFVGSRDCISWSDKIMSDLRKAMARILQDRAKVK